MIEISRHPSASKVTIGESPAIAKDVEVDTTGNVIIGNDVIISSGVMILTHNHKPNNPHEWYSSDIEICDGAWIGARAIVLASVNKIGKKSVIGAGSVLTKSVPDGELWAGNPAKKIKDLKF